MAYTKTLLVDRDAADQSWSRQSIAVGSDGRIYQLYVVFSTAANAYRLRCIGFTVNANKSITTHFDVKVVDFPQDPSQHFAAAIALNYSSSAVEKIIVAVIVDDFSAASDSCTLYSMDVASPATFTVGDSFSAPGAGFMGSWFRLFGRSVDGAFSNIEIIYIGRTDDTVSQPYTAAQQVIKHRTMTGGTGGTWSAAVSIDTNGTMSGMIGSPPISSQARPALDVARTRDGAMHILYNKNDTLSQPKLFYRKWTSGGGWGAATVAVLLTNPASLPDANPFPTLSADENGNLHAFALRYDDVAFTIPGSCSNVGGVLARELLYGNLPAGSSTWTWETALDDGAPPPGTSWLPNGCGWSTGLLQPFVRGGGQPCLVWVGHDGGNTSLYTLNLLERLAAGSWQHSANLVPMNTIVDSPFIAVSAVCVPDEVAYGHRGQVVAGTFLTLAEWYTAGFYVVVSDDWEFSLNRKPKSTLRAAAGAAQNIKNISIVTRVFAAATATPSAVRTRSVVTTVGTHVAGAGGKSKTVAGALRIQTTAQAILDQLSKWKVKSTLAIATAVSVTRVRTFFIETRLGMSGSPSVTEHVDNHVGISTRVEVHGTIRINVTTRLGVQTSAILIPPEGCETDYRPTPDVPADPDSRQFVVFAAPYPALARSVTLPRPDPGDERHLGLQDEITRRRDGSIQIVSRSPVPRSFRIGWKDLSRARALELEALCSAYAGAEFLYTDYYGMKWRGRVLNPPSIESGGPESNATSIEFEGVQVAS